MRRTISLGANVKVKVLRLVEMIPADRFVSPGTVLTSLSSKPPDSIEKASNFTSQITAKQTNYHSLKPVSFVRFILFLLRLNKVRFMIICEVELQLLLMESGDFEAIRGRCCKYFWFKTKTMSWKILFYQWSLVVWTKSLFFLFAAASKKVFF